MMNREMTMANFSRFGWSLNRSTMIGATASASRRNGNDRKTSITKAITRSSQPRLKPAIRPTLMPMSDDTTVTDTAMLRDVRAP